MCREVRVLIGGNHATATSRQQLVSCADMGALAVMAEAELVNGDYVELHCTNETSTATVTWRYGLLNVRPVKLV